jgi:hypothetical protein
MPKYISCPRDPTMLLPCLREFAFQNFATPSASNLRCPLVLPVSEILKYRNPEPSGSPPLNKINGSKPPLIQRLRFFRDSMGQEFRTLTSCISGSRNTEIVLFGDFPEISTVCTFRDFGIHDFVNPLRPILGPSTFWYSKPRCAEMRILGGLLDVRHVSSHRWRALIVFGTSPIVKSKDFFVLCFPMSESLI